MFGDCTHTASKIAAALFAHTTGERGRFEPFDASNAQVTAVVQCSKSTFQRALRQLCDPTRPVYIRRIYTPNKLDIFDRRPSRWQFVDNRKRRRAMGYPADAPVYGPPMPTRAQWRVMRADRDRIRERERKARAAARKRRALEALRATGDVDAYQLAMGREPVTLAGERPPTPAAGTRSVAPFSSQIGPLCDPGLPLRGLSAGGIPSASAPTEPASVASPPAGDSAPRHPPGRAALRAEGRAPERAPIDGVAASPATSYRAGDSSPEPPSPTDGASAERAAGENSYRNPLANALRAQRGQLVAPDRTPPESKRPEPVGPPCAVTGLRGCTCSECAAGVRAAIAESLATVSLDSNGKRRGDTVPACQRNGPAKRSSESDVPSLPPDASDASATTQASRSTRRLRRR